LIVLILIGCLLTPARDFWLSRQRYEYKYKLAAIVSIGTAIIGTLLSIFVVMDQKSKGDSNVVEGRLISNYLVIFSISLFLWVFLFRKGHTFYNRNYWKFSLTLSIPLIGYQLAAQILSVSDRFMISKMVNNSAVGIYSTLYTVSSISLLVWNAINSSFVPYLFQNIGKRGNKIKAISTKLLIAYSLIAIVLTYLAPEILKILATKEYYGAIYIMPPIAAGIFFTSLSNLYSDIAVYYKKTNYVMIPTAFAAILNIVLNYIFIKDFGYIAAAYTTLVSYVVLGILQAYFANKLHSLKTNNTNKIYDDKKIIALSVFTVFGCLFALLLYSHTALRYCIVAFLVFVILIMLMNSKKIKNIEL
jgi:O-antigen/teichoic acid export membrane protein